MTRRHFLIATIVILFGGLPCVGKVVRGWARRAALAEPDWSRVGQELALPIKDMLAYESWARRVFKVRPLPQGEVFTRDDLERLFNLR